VIGVYTPWPPAQARLTAAARYLVYELRNSSCSSTISSLAACAAAEDITGTILIKKRLTKQNVTPAVSV